MNKKLAYLIKVIKAGETSEEQLKPIIFEYMADNEEIIPNMLELLSRERELKKEIISEMGLNLGRNTGYIMGIIADKDTKKFILNETYEFYKKYEQYVRTTPLKLYSDLR